MTEQVRDVPIEIPFTQVSSYEVDPNFVNDISESEIEAVIPSTEFSTKDIEREKKNEIKKKPRQEQSRLSNLIVPKGTVKINQSKHSEKKEMTEISTSGLKKKNKKEIPKKSEKEEKKSKKEDKKEKEKKGDSKKTKRKKDDSSEEEKPKKKKKKEKEKKQKKEKKEESSEESSEEEIPKKKKVLKKGKDKEEEKKEKLAKEKKEKEKAAKLAEKKRIEKEEKEAEKDADEIGSEDEEESDEEELDELDPEHIDDEEVEEIDPEAPFELEDSNDDEPAAKQVKQDVIEVEQEEEFDKNHRVWFVYFDEEKKRKVKDFIEVTTTLKGGNQRSDAAKNDAIKKARVYIIQYLGLTICRELINDVDQELIWNGYLSTDVNHFDKENKNDGF